MSDAYKQIKKNHAKRHSHSNSHNERCKHCGSFISKPEPSGNQIKYVCTACGRAILEYVAKTPATSD